MFKNKPYRIVPLGRIVLLKLYVEHVNDSSKSSYTVDELVAKFAVPVSRNLVASALEQLYQQNAGGQKYLKAARNRKDKSKAYSITGAGMMLVERALRQQTSDLAHYSEHGDSALDDVAGVNGLFTSPEERSEFQDWRPLEINQDQPAYKEMVEAVEEVIDQAEDSNELTSRFPSEKRGLLASLREGLEWLRERAPTKSQVRALIVMPLRWLSTTFANGALGEIAKRAAHAVLDWLSQFL